MVRVAFIYLCISWEECQTKPYSLPSKTPKLYKSSQEPTKRRKILYTKYGLIQIWRHERIFFQMQANAWSHSIIGTE